jgi:hypothetical protein
MRNLRFKDSAGRYWKQVSKPTAKKLYNSGTKIHLCPVNFKPFGPWSIGAEVDNHYFTPFDQIVNSFEFYNCNGEAGKYTTFYTLDI